MALGTLSPVGIAIYNLHAFSTAPSGHASNVSAPNSFWIFSCICFFYIHYVFASITARVTVTYSTFLVTFLHIGLPPLPSALGLGYLSVLSAGLTHYGIGSAPIFFGAGYITASRWWKKSFIISFVNLFVWSFFSLIWWKILGWY